MSDVDHEQRRWCDPRAAVLAAKLASVVSDPVTGVAGEAEGAPATPAPVEIRDQELVATVSSTPADDRHPLAAAMLELRPGLTPPTRSVGEVEAFSHDALDTERERRDLETFIEGERARDASDPSGELLTELAEQLATLPVRERAGRNSVRVKDVEHL